MEARVLGQLLTLQSFLDAIARDEDMLRFAVRGLCNLPGVAEASVCLDGRRISGDATGAVRLEACRAPDREGGCDCLPVDEDCLHSPLLRQTTVIGHFILRLAPRAEAEPYLAYYRNFGQWLSLVLSNRRHMEMMEAAYRQAQDASAAKSEFLANMSHELRTPLNTVIGYSETLLSGALGEIAEPKHREYLSDIHRSGSHLLSVINDMLDLARIEAGRLELVEEVVGLRELGHETLALVRPAAGKAGVRLSLALPDDLAVLVDRLRFKQVLVNLLANAVKFTPEGGRVSVNGGLGRGGAVWVAVRDSGIGMSADELRTAKTRFGQVDSILARRHAGTGLGLTLVEGLIRAHGGRFVLRSQPGAGTDAVVVLPRWRRLAA